MTRHGLVMVTLSDRPRRVRRNPGIERGHFVRLKNEERGVHFTTPLGSHMGPWETSPVVPESLLLQIA